MSISRIAATVALVLTAAASLAISPVGAQEGEGDLVSTACASGYETKCGTEPTHQTCEFEFSINKGGGSIFGISIGFRTCTFHGSRDVFKDFRRDAVAGSCVAHPRPITPPDATSVSARDHEETIEGLSEC